MKNSVRD